MTDTPNMLDMDYLRKVLIIWLRRVLLLQLERDTSTGLASIALRLAAYSMIVTY